MASKSGDGGTVCALEFAVQMSCQSCVDAVHKTLKGVAGVQNVDVQLENQMVLVQTTLPSQERIWEQQWPFWRAVAPYRGWSASYSYPLNSA
ncbi:copper chaperone for superoxide dismutase, isoform CRA_c [Mus musculus]|nr:copper chaperone for superoxide dismutase, isoform CRA_c [Mus musculus]